MDTGIVKNEPEVLITEIKTEDVNESERIRTDCSKSDVLETEHQHEFGTEDKNKPDIGLFTTNPSDTELERKESQDEFIKVKSEDQNNSGKYDDFSAPLNFASVKIEYAENAWDTPALKEEIKCEEESENQDMFMSRPQEIPKEEILVGNSENFVPEKEPEFPCNETKSLEIKCDVCNRIFMRKAYLRDHYRTHTGEKPYVCDVCNRCFTQIGTLNAHYRTHTGEKPYKCQYCDKAFSVRSNMRSHYKVHTGERLHKCDLCDEVFKMPSSLKTHLKTHAGIKTFKCKVCRKELSRKDGLKKHMRTHTGEKPYKCDMCGHESSAISNLKGHVKSHLSMKTYECSKCNKKYAKCKQLEKHIETNYK